MKMKLLISMLALSCVAAFAADPVQAISKNDKELQTLLTMNA